MDSLILQIDEEIERRSLLKHPFYEMWSHGKLTRDHLSGYSMEYFQLVRAVPEMVKNIEAKSGSNSKEEIQRNLREESEHVNLWIKFASSLGISNKALLAYPGMPGTIRAVEEMKKLTTISLDVGIAGMYAYERDVPKISATKIKGLKEFYGMDSADALEYFQEHEKADVRHAAVWRSLLENVKRENQEAALRGAVRSLAAQNRLLDSVMEKYVA